jgi:hypothetical protein
MLNSLVNISVKLSKDPWFYPVIVVGSEKLSRDDMNLMPMVDEFFYSHAPTTRETNLNNDSWMLYGSRKPSNLIIP